MAKEKGWAGASTVRTNAGLLLNLKNKDIAVKSRSNPHSHRHSDVVELHIRTICSARSQSLRQTCKTIPGRTPPLLSRSLALFFRKQSEKSRRGVEPTYQLLVHLIQVPPLNGLHKSPVSRHDEVSLPCLKAHSRESGLVKLRARLRPKVVGSQKL